MDSELKSKVLAVAAFIAAAAVLVWRFRSASEKKQQRAAILEKAREAKAQKALDRIDLDENLQTD